MLILCAKIALNAVICMILFIFLTFGVDLMGCSSMFTLIYGQVTVVSTIHFISIYNIALIIVSLQKIVPMPSRCCLSLIIKRLFDIFD